MWGLRAVDEVARQVLGLDVALLSLSQAAEAVFQLSLIAAFTTWATEKRDSSVHENALIGTVDSERTVKT